MRNFNPYTAAELAKEVFAVFGFVSLSLAATHRFTSADIDLYSAGNKYMAKGFKITSMSISSGMSVDRATLSFANGDGYFNQPLMAEDIAGKSVLVSIGAVAANYSLLGLEPLFAGDVTGHGPLKETVAVNVAGLKRLWSKKTLRIAQATCPWPIGGDECGYTGNETCSQNYEQCKIFGNYLNFGGFPFLPGLMTREIWWGRKPS